MRITINAISTQSYTKLQLQTVMCNGAMCLDRGIQNSKFIIQIVKYYYTKVNKWVTRIPMKTNTVQMSYDIIAQNY